MTAPVWTRCCETVLGEVGFCARVVHTSDGLAWAVEFTSPEGEVLMRQECHDSQRAHAVCDSMAEGARTAVSMLKNLPRPVVDRIAAVLVESLRDEALEQATKAQA